MNYLQTLNFGSHKLKSNNIKTHILDSELLLSHIINKPREYVLLNFQAKITKNNFREYNNLLLRRKQGEPIAYITKKKEFWKSNFFVNKDVLIPRPETEIIVEQVLNETSISTNKRLLEGQNQESVVHFPFSFNTLRSSSWDTWIMDRAVY